MAKQISETHSANATTPPSQPISTQSVRKSGKTKQQSRIYLEPVPDSTASLRKKLQAKRRRLKQQEKQKKQAQRQKAKQRSRQLSSKQSCPQIAEAKIAVTSSLAPASPVSKTARSNLPHQWRFLKRLGLAVGIMGVACGGGWVALEIRLPDTTHLVSETRQRGGTLTLKSADGAVVFQSGPASRQTVDIDQIPQPLQDAFIATEDRRFSSMMALMARVLCGQCSRTCCLGNWQKAEVPSPNSWLA